MSREPSPADDLTPRPFARHLSDPLHADTHLAPPRVHARFASPGPSSRISQTAPPTPDLRLPNSMLGFRKHGSTSTLRSNTGRPSRAASIGESYAMRPGKVFSSYSLADTDAGGLSTMQMAALIEIQRVLYHGGRGLARKGKARSMPDDEDANELATVVERFLEPDCAYESPFVTLPTRSLLLSFFHLSSVLSSMLLPSLTPTGLLYHIKSATSLARAKVCNVDDSIEPAPDAWWKAWDVWGDCGEIGGMECFDGFHLGLIDQTINIHFLPHLMPDSLPVSPNPISDGLYARVPTLPRSLLGTAISHALRWELRIVTVVEFNEAGKVSYMRDLLDLREILEAVVPFGRAIGWIARRVTGLAAVGLCSILSTVRPALQSAPSGKSKWPPKDDEEWAVWHMRMSDALDAKVAEKAGGDDALSRTSTRSDGAVRFDLSKDKRAKAEDLSDDNMLGLSSSVKECAPDVDQSVL